MSNKMQNHGLMFFMFLNSLVYREELVVEEGDPRVLKLKSLTSSYFLCGRDTNDEPFLGVPIGMMPWFTEIDWVAASICRSEGYLYLEARDPRHHGFLLGLGIKIRSKRLDVFSIKDHEDAASMCMNLKVFEANPSDLSEIFFAEHHEVIGIPLQEIDSCLEIGDGDDPSMALQLMAESGLDKTFVSTKLTR
jgi:hypothetical protein